MTLRLLPLLALLGLNTFAQAAPIHDDARQGNLPAVRALLQQDPKQVNAVTSDRMVMTPLHFAAQFGQVEMVKFLLAQGADVHARDGNRATPLFRAALRGQTACAELLIRAGADVNAEGNENIRPPASGRDDGAYRHRQAAAGAWRAHRRQGQHRHHALGICPHAGAEGLVEDRRTGHAAPLNRPRSRHRSGASRPSSGIHGES